MTWGYYSILRQKSTNIVYITAQNYYPFFVGFLFLALAAAALAAGLLLKETALFVFALPVLAVLGYALLAGAAVFLAAKRRAGLLGVECVPQAGEAHTGTVSALLSGDGRGFFAPPAILVRYMIRMQTKDGRVLSHIFSKSFFTGKLETFQAGARGAYFAPVDYLLICDIFGFFRFRRAIPAREGARLLLYPSWKGGGVAQKK